MIQSDVIRRGVEIAMTGRYDKSWFLQVADSYEEGVEMWKEHRAAILGKDV